MNVTSETWLPIPGYPNYEASDQGRIRSLPHEVPSRGGTRISPGRVLKARKRADDYWQVALYIAGKTTVKYFLVHGLVAAAHIGPRPEGFDVCHNDGDQDNNAVTNLRYAPHGQNIRDQVRHGTHAQASRTKCKYGHEWTEDNIYRHPTKGHRLCRACRRDRRRQKVAA
ncbi:NUMOD4 motif-containing HNH endonuclease [Mycobacterium sp. G7A2]|uniref:NUMOD4 motif-containing HNH endonuclease n=1 Tax=Mycobacterium sp. G7A2 TaxID=3317307 RepID=UPI0035A8E1FD